MNIEKDLFAKYRLISEDKLLSFGFKLIDDEYRYEFYFHNDEFKAEIKYKNKKIEAKVIELAFDDDFDAINIESITGEYIFKLREEYKDKLIKIRDACFHKVLFIYDQANRITNSIISIYNEEPDFPFKDLDGYAVFRYKENNKWYGLIMNVKKSKLTKNEDDKDIIEIINIKVDPKEKDDLIKIDGIYTCYHMNKASWVSIILDDTLPDEKILELIGKSRALIMTLKKK